MDIDCSSFLPEKILVKLQDRFFFVQIGYEKLPEFCFAMWNFGTYS